MARITPVTVCTRNAVSVAEPSVWNQFVSRGTLRKRKYRSPPISPERSSSQSIGYSTICSMRCLRADLGINGPSGDVALLLPSEKQARQGRREPPYPSIRGRLRTRHRAALQPAEGGRALLEGPSTGDVA